jgi:hypothetical protein
MALSVKLRVLTQFLKEFLQQEAQDQAHKFYMPDKMNAALRSQEVD